MYGEKALLPRYMEYWNIRRYLRSQWSCSWSIWWCTKKEIFVPFGYKVYEQRNAIYQSVNIGSYYVNESKYREMSRFAVKSGDYIISCSGTIGRIYQIPLTFPKGIINQALLKLTINTEKINPTYFYKYFQWDKFQQKIIDDTQGGAMKNLVGMDIFKKAPIVLPEMKEQTAIAEALSDIDGLISSLQKLIEKKKAIKQGTMQELLTGKKRLPGFSGKWETRKVGELCSIVTKQTGFDYTSIIKPNLLEHPQSNAMPMIQTKNFEGRKFDFATDYYLPTDIAKVFDKIVLNTVCLLFSIVGASVGNIGLFPGDKVAFCGGAIGIAKFYHEIDAVYAFYYFLSESGQQQIRNVTKGGAQATVTIEDIREFTIPYPNLKERTMIAQTLSDMDSEIEQLEKKLAKYQQIKQGMMQELLTGRIRLIDTDRGDISEV